MAMFDEIRILIPCHSLEDFPSELSEEEAEGLLNAFAIGWHPLLISEAESVPKWDRADEPPLHVANQLFVIPPVCEGWMPHEWGENARSNGATVIEGAKTRSEYLAQIEQLFQDRSPSQIPVLTEDFLALGFCWLMIELLTRKMHYYSSVDESSIEREGTSAARASLAGDEAGTRAHLKGCFETLLESREHFYPVDCYLIDVCLLHPDSIDEHFDQTLERGTPINFLSKGEDLARIEEADPDRFQELRQAVEREQADVIGGEYHEKPLSLQPLGSLLWDLQNGIRFHESRFGKRPRTWARKRYGFSTQLPQILENLGYHSAVHVALDDGLYPDEEHSKFRWEGCDGTIIDAISRIPLAADGAVSYLRLPDRMAESMQDDQVAGLFFARWPELNGAWFFDLLRIQEYAPVLGRFVTFNDFIEQTDHSGRLAQHSEAEYLTPYFLQSVAFGETDPVSRYVRFLSLRHKFDQGLWQSRVSTALGGKPIEPDEHTEWESRIEHSGPDPSLQPEELSSEEIHNWNRNQAGKLGALILSPDKPARGRLLINSLAHPRRESVSLKEMDHPPVAAGPVKGVQFDATHREAIVEIAGSGFAWIPEGTKPTSSDDSTAPLAEEMVLRNEFFEVLINEQTGGIQHLKNHGRSPNRLSQQLAFRFPRERNIVTPGDPPREIQTQYSEARMTSAEVTSTGPLVGEIKTMTELIDQESGEVIAACQQVTRVRRGLRYVEIDLSMTPTRKPEGDPWNCYYASRFAWKDDSVSLTRGILQGAFPVQGDRIEAPYYFEIASGDRRTTLLCGGLPFHRKSGPRMIDTILIPERESARHFQLRIAVDEDYPMNAAMEYLSPLTSFDSEFGPRSAPEGWFFHLKEKNIQILSLEPLLADPDAEEGQSDSRPGFALRLLETEGRSRKCILRLFKTPAFARKRNFLGGSLRELDIRKERVFIDFRAHELVDVEFRFDK